MSALCCCCCCCCSCCLLCSFYRPSLLSSFYFYFFKWHLRWLWCQWNVIYGNLAIYHRWSKDFNLCGNRRALRTMAKEMLFGCDSYLCLCFSKETKRSAKKPDQRTFYSIRLQNQKAIISASDNFKWHIHTHSIDAETWMIAAFALSFQFE